MVDQVTLKPHTSGDTWLGLTLTLTRNNAPMDLAGARVDMQMRRVAASTAILQSWTSSGLTPSILISGNTISVGKRQITGVGKIYFDVQVTKVDGDVLTVMSGVLPVVEDVTRV